MHDPTENDQGINSRHVENGKEDSTSQEKTTYSPDDILNMLGGRNVSLIRSVILMAFTWTPIAMTSMGNAFFSQDCGRNCSSNTSIAVEFELYDERRHLLEMATSAFMFGNMLGGGAVFFADRFGRKPTFLTAYAMITAIGVMASFSTSVYIFAFFRFLQGIAYTCAGLTGWVLAYECTPTSIRAMPTLIFGMNWVFGYILVAPAAYLSPNWRVLIIVVSTPQLILAVLCYFVVPESLHFLVSKEKTEKVEEWIEDATKGEKPLNVKASNIRSDAEELKTSFLYELRTHKIFIVYMAAMVYLWICDTFIYFGLSLYSTHLSGNTYWNYILLGLVEVPAYIFAPFAMKSFGRRPVIGGTHFLAAVAFFGLSFTHDDGNWLQLIMWATGKFAISCTFMSIYTYASEIFPTNIRNVSIGFCETMSRFGAISAPFVATLSQISPMLSTGVLCAMCIAAGLCTFVLPETVHRQLPGSITQSTQKR